MSLHSLRADARAIFSAGLRPVDPFDAVMRTLELRNNHLQVALKTYDLAAIQNIYVAGCGKAAARMALAVETLLQNRICGGIAVVKYGHGLQLDKIKTVEAGHPIPDLAGLNGARAVMNLARECGAADLLIFLISGGGSALLPCPVDGLSLEDKQKTTKALLQSGATIQEVNAVRKHISKIKGGRLAQVAAPAQLIALILSDVIDDSTEAIASGPTAPDSSTYADCLRIIDRYDKLREIPPAVIDVLDRGAKGEIAETPKPSDKVFDTVQNIIVGNNRAAVAAAQRHAEALGYRTTVLSTSMAGESRVVAKSHVALAKDIRRSNSPSSPPNCLISGGETTVTVRGEGLGGRNQEFCLSAAVEIEGLDGLVILSGGTDGSDGPTDAAGAIVDGSTIDRGRAKKLDAKKFLERNDSYHFLQATGDLLVTGPTFTNVMDLQITLIHQSSIESVRGTISK
jgi:glycerate 2-kinase